MSYQRLNELAAFMRKIKDDNLFFNAVADLENTANEIIELKNKLAEAQWERDEAKSLAERLKQEAQIHAQESRTANASLRECYQAVTGAAGEPGNWHGATPIREAIATLRIEKEAAEQRAVAAEQECQRLREAMESAIRDSTSWNATILSLRISLRAALAAQPEAKS